MCVTQKKQKKNVVFRFVLVINFLSLQTGDVVTSTQGVYCDGDPLGLLQQLLFVDYSDLV